MLTVSNNTQVGCAFKCAMKISSIHYLQPELLKKGHMDPRFHVRFIHVSQKNLILISSGDVFQSLIIHFC